MISEVVMTDRYFCVPLPDGREVCISPLSRATYEHSCAAELGDDFGYFIYEYSLKQPHAGLEVLAKAASYDAALRLADIYIAASFAPRESAKHTTTQRKKKKTPPKRAKGKKSRRASRSRGAASTRRNPLMAYG